MPDLKQAALGYAAAGFRVFPLKQASKKPATEHGFLDATTDTEQIDRWWSENPSYNIGIATEGLAVVDVDPGGGEWLAEHDEILSACMMTTAIATTPRKGRHYVFRQNGSAIASGTRYGHPNIDVRANGGYLAVWPSITTDGRYSWTGDVPKVDDLPVLPDVLERFILTEKLSVNGPEPGSVDADWRYDGPRHDWFMTIVNQMSQAGLHPDIIKRTVSEANRRQCVNPRPEHELESEVDRLLRSNKYRLDAATVASAISLTGGNDDPDGMPLHLLHGLPDVCQEAFAYYQSMAWKIQPELFLGSLIAMTSTLIGGRLFTERGTRSNVYVLGVAGTGAGKNACREWIKLLLADVGASDRVESGKITSFSSMTTTLRRAGGNCLVMPDEFGKVLTEANDRTQVKAASTIVHGLLELYSASRDPNYNLVAYADDKKRQPPIPFPTLSLFATTTATTLWQRMTSSNLEDGLLPRMLIFEGDESPVESEPTALAQPPELLRDFCKRWLTVDGNLVENAINGGQPVSIDDDARAVLRDFRRYCNEQISDDSPEGLVWSRTTENAEKLALVHATWQHGLNDGLPVIGRQSAEWSVDVVRYSAGRLIRQIGDHLADNELDRIGKQILHIIRQHADESGWCHQYKLTKRVGTAAFRAAIRMLLEVGHVEKTTEQTKGRPASLYRLGPDLMTL